MLAQIVGEQLGGDLSNILVQTGNPNFAPGFGGFNSRQTVVAGASAHKAATIVRKKSLQVAASILNAAPDELDIAGNGVVRRGANEPGVSFAELAKAAAGLPGFPLPGDIESPGLQSLQQVVINDLAFSNGCAIAEVEVDEETGRVRVLDVSLSHDCGRMVNPMTVDGQVVGGIAHGIGNSLFEKMGFDTEAQPTTTTLADYLLVTASEMPNVNLSHRESPSPLNELGVKGVGESGVIPMTAAIASAIDDALSDLGIHVSSMPISPQELKMLIDGARNGS
jgi:carbon-monoxide dehydrogenase large subunit